MPTKVEQKLATAEKKRKIKLVFALESERLGALSLQATIMLLARVEQILPPI